MKREYVIAIVVIAIAALVYVIRVVYFGNDVSTMLTVPVAS